MAYLHRVAIVLGIIALCSARSAAQPAREAAAKLFEEANQRFAAREYDVALEKYLAARALFPSYKIDFNVASTLNALERFEEAAAYYERFLEAGEQTAPRRMVRLGRSRFDELKLKFGSVRLTCAVEGAAVLVDERNVGQTPLELSIYLAPGRHQLTVQKSGYATYQVALELGAGQRRELTVALEATPAPEPGGHVTLSVGEPARQAAGSALLRDPALLVKRETTDAQLAVRRSKTRWAQVTLGMSLACAVTAIILYAAGGRQGSVNYPLYKNATDAKVIAARRDDVESAQQKLIAGHVLLGAAVAAGAVSLYEFLTRPAVGAARVVPERDRRSRLSLLPAAAGGSVQWLTSF